MGIVFSTLKKYRVAAIAALVMMLIELTAELIQPLLISKIIDDGIQKQDMSVVWMWGAVLTGSAVIAFIAGISSSFFAAHTSQGLGYDLRDQLYEKVQSFSYSIFNRFATSSLITRLTGDVTQIQDTVFMGLRFMTRVPLVVLGSIVMALVVNVKLGLLLVLTVPVLFIFIAWIMKRAADAFRRVQQRLDAVNGVIQENLTGIRLIRVFVRMGHEIERFGRTSGKLMSSTISTLRLTETTMPFILLIMNAGIMAVLWFGRKDIATGSASVGEVVAVVNYSLRCIGAMSALSWVVVAFSRGRASAQRAQEVLKTEDDAATGVYKNHDNKVEIEGGVKFEQVSFSYPGSDIDVLTDISFVARPGERIAIMGATGSGKSSLVQLIPRLYEEDKGNVRIDGKDAGEIDPMHLRSSIGYVPQEVLLFSGTVRENIAWGREDASMDEIKEAARRAQIHDTIEHLPNGYDTMLGQRGVNLSGGQKQRLSIARALVRKPSILILDDSTSALDVRTEGALLDALKDLSCTTFLITQKISSTTSADLILLLDDGRLIGKGNHDSLMESSSLYRRIYESQYGEGVQQHA
ncbi:ABC transporter ATP-binding protein [Paenibacillus glucanolyticus]|uniref:ABC transporter ATP-binding protein n=1 Tax=Paenibacillus TaxID=44249 RepID=UPI0003E29E9F|nr:MULTISPECIES: ABC transporter ATP-binding protein [Paenibacillus]ANA81250.1 ABC transporter ATP-binding protein [Paenibacillus glucanolyticus]AVV60019.1 ABC transporter ATP-binding protein [Paenibacillus glucanolyticus]ETT35841.1 ABC transporter-like protein [Paenibacillus sp. FSL R5-808]OMF67050.1 ABC transporter ATP-binding protein [Paenibacillus glucanolyticus]